MEQSAADQQNPGAETFRSEQAAYLREAEAIIDAAEQQGVQLRLLGAIAVIKHCPQFIWLHEATNRELTDIDYMAYSKQQKEIRALLTGMGYAVKGGGGGGVTMDVWSSREIYVDPEGARHSVDIFYDKLDFCHPIEFKGRLQLDSPTIPLSDILLEKLQIVEINEKDLKDLMVLFLEHPIATESGTTEQIDSDYIVGLLAKDWGFYHTVNMNLDRVLQFLPTYEAFEPEHQETIKRRIAELRELIEAKPKSMKWKMRARVGTKQKWYRDVGEEYREIGR